MIHRDDIWKFLSLIVFVCAGLSAHNDFLFPAVLVPLKPWIEVVALVGGLVQAWRMQPSGGQKLPVVLLAAAIGWNL